MTSNRIWLWTWGGKCFGYKDGENLRTHGGKHVGRFVGEEVYDQNGYYIGEIRNDNRLITNLSKKNKRGGIFTPYANYAAYAKYADYAGYAMYAGYEDFPDSEAL